MSADQGRSGAPRPERWTYLLHGLRVRSEFELPGAATREHDGAADLTVRWGDPRATSDEIPDDAEILVDNHLHGRRWYAAWADGDSITVRVPSICEFSLAADLDTVICHPDPASDPQFVPILVTGTIISMVLLLRGEVVLHASAVDVDGTAVAIAGTSGMGKSTVAALFCSVGAALVTDDVLRLRRDPEFRCLPGATELRIRPKAAALIDEFREPPTVRDTVDGRLAVTPARLTSREVPLGCLLIPFPSRDATSVTASRISGADALVRLLSFPRLLGWRSPAVLTEQFAALADLATAVPVVEATIPWGPPFHSRTGDELLGHLPLRTSA